MLCRRLVASGLVWLTLAGCGADQYGLAAEPPGAARAQKPEGEPVQQTAARSLLNVAPERLTDPKSGRVTASIRAIVGNQAILDEEVRDASFPYLLEVARLPEPERTSRSVQIFTRELQKLIEREVILQDAYARLNKGGQKYLAKLTEASQKEFDRQVRSMKERAGAKSDEELKDMMRSQGLSLDGMRRQFERSFIARQYMLSRMEPAVDKLTQHDYIVEYYRSHPEEFQIQDAVQWQDIFVDATKYPSREAARQFAAELIRRAKAGEDFGKLSAQYDNGDSSYRNGEGYGRRRGEIRPAEAEAPLFSLKDGDIGPIVEQANGFHVIRLVKRDYAGVQVLDEKTQARIREKLREEIAGREYKRIVAELKRNTVIEYAKLAP